MRLQNLRAREVIRILEREGFEIKRQSGTHVILRNNGRTVVVPVHHAIIPIGTLKSIERQAGISFREKV